MAGRRGRRLASLLVAVLWALAALSALLTWGAFAQSALAVDPVGGPTAGTLPADGAQRALRRLTTDGATTPLAWTPDGAYLLVQQPGKVIGAQHLSELWLLSPDTSEERLLSENAFQVSASAHGAAYLAFVAPDHWVAYVVYLDGRAEPLGPAARALAPRWIGTQVVYDASRQHLVRISPGKAVEHRPLSSAMRRGQRALLSPDGRWLAVTDGRALWVSGPDGEHTLHTDGTVYGLSWSPGGERLAYVVSADGPRPELWIWERDAGRSQLLLRADMEHWGAPRWAPDGRRLALSRHPTGSGPNANGDLWVVGLDSTAYPLARTLSDESAPCWSPDGRRLAFSRDGDAWVAELNAPDLEDALLETDTRAPAWDDPSSATALALPAPTTIRVLHDAQHNTCRNVSDGQIDVYELEEYVKRVVPNEVYTSWPAETLKAQAVAARTYAWRKALDRRAAGLEYDVRDSTADQHMCDETHGTTNAAVDATRGQYVSHADKVIYAYYSAENGSPTNYRQEHPSVPYLRPVDDPVGLGQMRRGHSWGMSQWGAYRWAHDWGWNYQQILCHYYTGASVQPSAGTSTSLAALIAPWPGSFSGSSWLALEANASTASVDPLTITLSARITETWTAVYTETLAYSTWPVVWSVRAYSDTVTPSIRLSVTVHNADGHTLARGAEDLGLDRQPPSGTLAVSSTDVCTLSVPLVLSATDSAETTTGSIQVSLGDATWQWQDADLPALGGAIVTDSAASDGSAWHVPAGSSGILFGPYTTILTPGRAYRAWFRIRVPTAALSSTLELARLDVTRNAGTELLGIRYLHGTDVRAGNAYQEFGVDFYPEDARELEFRTHAWGTYDLWVDRVSVALYPVPLSPAATWSLPPREGPVTLTARYVDRAGNVSPDTSVTVTLTDRTAPGSWRDFGCTPAACVVQVSDAIAGLDPGSAAYRLSDDGGITWSEWISACSTGTPGSREPETITAPIETSPLTTTVGWVQFRIADAAAIPNLGSSPAYHFFRTWVFLPAVHR